MSRKTSVPRARLQPMLGLLFALFVIVQGLALGARVADSSGAWFGILEGAAVVVILALVATVWWHVVSRVSARRLQALTAKGHTAWMASSHSETRRALESISIRGVGRLPAVFLIELRNGDLCVVEPPKLDPLVRIPASTIREVNVGRAYGFGGSSECLVVAVDTRGGDIRLPLVLHRDNPPHFFTQGNDALARSRAQLVRQLAAGAPSSERNSS